MDLDHPAVLFSAMLIGLVGFALFLSGKKSGSGVVLAAGVALSVLPMATHSLLVLWGGTAACLGGVWAIRRG